MTTAHARGADVLLTINQHSRSADAPADARASTAASCGILRARYPWVTTMGAWNEANHKTQPLVQAAAHARRSSTT